MDHASQRFPIMSARTALELFQPDVSGIKIAHWRINGYSASIIVWTSEEWELLSEQPSDAQYYSCGVWCALRLA